MNESELPEKAGDTFRALGLPGPLLHALDALGYEEPTPIQKEAIPPLLAGRDLLGQAATGTGKTAAFALPLLQRIHEKGPKPDDERPIRALVLVPTRELAMQVAEAIHRYGSSAFGTRVTPVYGGQAIQQQLRALKRGVDVVVATPGRALDHIERRSLNLDSVSFVVLDEADEMLDMGFAEDLEAILNALPSERQTALLSATMARRVAAIAEKHLQDPVRVTIHAEKVKGESPLVRQTAYVVPRQQKLAALGRVLDMEDPASAIIFCRTRGEVDQLTESLAGHGYRADALHGGLSQEQRDRVMKKFREGNVELLVATDVAARGLDIESVSHVVNYDVPSSPDAYVHRIGRTGRAGRTGVAITLAEPREHRYLKNIEQLTKQKISVEKVPTIVDLRARRLDLTRSAIQEALMSGDLGDFRVVVETLGTEYDVMEIATAAVKVAHESRAGGAASGEATVADIPDLSSGRTADREGKKRGKDRERDSATRDGRQAKGGKRGAKRSGSGEVTRVYINIGRSAGVRPADIVGAIANEAGVNPRGIGSIDIADSFSIVEVVKEDAEVIIETLRGIKLRGKRVTAREDRARRPGR